MKRVWSSILEIFVWYCEVGSGVLVVVKRFWSSEVGSGVLKRFWSSVLELHAWCFEVGSGVVKRVWSSILELHAGALGSEVVS